MLNNCCYNNMEKDNIEVPSRAVFICPDCKTNVSMDYLMIKQLEEAQDGC